LIQVRARFRSTEQARRSSATQRSRFDSQLSRRRDLGLLIIRISLGGTLVAHGTQKLFGWFGGHGLSGTTGGMEAMGFHPPKISAVMAGLGEAGGGALLALGLATPVAGAATASTMLAAGAVHQPAGFSPLREGSSTANPRTGWCGHRHLRARSLFPGSRTERSLNRPWMAAVALTALGSASVAILARRRMALDSAAPTALDPQ